MEQGLYEIVVMLSPNYLMVNESNKNKNEDKFKFQGQAARSQHWFDIYFDWIEENCITHEPDFYKTIYQRHGETQDTNKFKMSVVPIGNAKNVKEMRFDIDAPTLKYPKNTSNSCCVSSLVSAFESINQIKTANDISNRTEESLTSQVGFGNCTDFVNAV